MRHIFWLLCLVAVTGMAQTSDHQRPTVYWYYNDFPPYFIVSGADQGKGIADQRIDILTQRMPQFQHTRVLASFSRVMEMIKKHPNVCHAALFKTAERAAELEFSMPLLESLPNGLIVLSTRFAQFKPFLDQRDQLRLDDFLNKGYRIGIVAGRSFGLGADRILEKNAGQQSIVAVSSNDGLSSRLLKLVNQHEYDGILGYSEELQNVVRQLKLNPHDFVFIPIAEQSELQPAYVACSKSELGKQVIAAVNRALTDRVTRQKIEAAYRSWLDETSAVRWDRLRRQPHSINE